MSKKQKRYSLLAPLNLVISLILINGCTNLRVETDYKPETDFSSYKSFSWYEKTMVPTIGNVSNTLLDDRVRSAVDSSLNSRSFVEVEEGADFLITYHFSVERKLESSNVSVGFGMSPRGSSMGVGVNSGSRLKEYEQGTLMIDMLHPNGKELLWRGYVEKRLYDNQTPEERNLDVQEAVQAIIMKFPPQK